MPSILQCDLFHHSSRICDSIPSLARPSISGLATSNDCDVAFSLKARTSREERQSRRHPCPTRDACPKGISAEEPFLGRRFPSGLRVEKGASAASSGWMEPLRKEGSGNQTLLRAWRPLFLMCHHKEREIWKLWTTLAQEAVAPRGKLDAWDWN